MNIVSLIGSPHGAKGATAALARLVMMGAEEEGASVETIYLKGDSVRPCLGCDTCHIKGRCPQDDEFASIVQKIMAADGIILGSPNYILSVSAQLKAFMDRCCGPIHLLSFEGRYGVSVVTSGGGDEPPIVDYMNEFILITGAIPVGGVWATMGLIQGHDFPEDIRIKALDLGRRLVQTRQKRQVPPEIIERRRVFYERMENLMRWRKDDWIYEYEYWVKNRGLK